MTRIITAVLLTITLTGCADFGAITIRESLALRMMRMKAEAIAPAAPAPTVADVTLGH